MEEDLPSKYGIFLRSSSEKLMNIAIVRELSKRVKYIFYHELIVLATRKVVVAIICLMNM